MIHMNARARAAAAMLAVACLTACGGSDTDETQPSDAYRQAVADANAKETEARALGVGNPCATTQQCANLQFSVPDAGCATLRFKPYSLVSPSAVAASAAAGEQTALAAKARALAPRSDLVCPAVVETPPVLACVAGQCQAATP